MSLQTYLLQDPEYLFLISSDKALKKALNLLPKKKSSLVLEIGCGNRWLKKFFIKNTTYLGIDLGFENNPDAVMTAEQLALRSATVDAVLCIAVLEHVNNPQKVFKECKRILRPGGLIILQAPALYPYHPYPRDHWRWTHTGLEQLCKNAGFTTKAIFPSGNTLTTYLTFFIQGIYLLLVKIRIPAKLRALIITALNLLGLLLEKFIPLISTYQDGGSLIMSFAILAKKP